MYRKPSSKAEYLAKIDFMFQNIAAIYNEVIIVGDFNLDISKTNFKNKINNLSKNSNLTQLINTPTRVTQNTKSILDLAFVSHPDMINNHGVHNLGLSDHSLIYLVRKSKKINLPPKCSKSRSFKHFNDAKFIDSLTKQNWNEVTNYSNVNDAWSTWSTMFIDMCNKHAPFKENKIKAYLPEWVTSDFLQLSKDKEYYYNKANKTNDPLDWDKAKALRNKVNNLSKTLKKNYYHNEIENNINNSKKLWKTIKTSIKKNCAGVAS